MILDAIDKLDKGLLIPVKQNEAEVTYAEAITMCLRVLGYANEIDSKGTWPTNYIAKAQDLKLMKGIDFGSYNDGAKRGDVALLIWNMLRTPMWKITSENQGTGMTSQASKIMLNVKFPDYRYIENYGSKNGTVICLTSPPDFPTDQFVIDWCKQMECFVSFISIEPLLGEYKASYFREMLRDWGKY